MKCHQCERPAIREMDSVHLCLSCADKASQMNYRDALFAAAMANQAFDDMESIAGVSLGGGRIPVAELAKAAQDKTVYNNINIRGSTIGVVNTGDLAKIDAAITITKDSDAEDIGTLLRELTQATLDAKEVADNDKKELIELIQSLSEQVVKSRKKSVTVSVLKGIEERAKGISAIWSVYERLAPLVENLFD